MTPSGVLCVDIEHGQGPTAVHGSTVRLHYVASLEDGTVFDSSYDRGLPLEITLGSGDVIRGCEEGLFGMREGGRRRLLVPAECAYGSAGLPEAVPPDSRVVMLVEVVEVHPPESQAPDEATP